MPCDDIIANMHYVCTTFRARKSSLFQRARPKNYKTREAVKKYGEAAKAGVQKTIDKIQELRREAATKIVTPGTPGFGVPPDAGSSPIQMP